MRLSVFWVCFSSKDLAALNALFKTLEYCISSVELSEMTTNLFVKSSELVEIDALAHLAVYHRVLGGLTLFDKAAADVLNEFRRPTPIDDDLLSRDHRSPREELLQQLLLRKFVVEDVDSKVASTYRDKGTGGDKVAVVQLVMINHCNFGCKYCFLGTQGADTKGRDVEKELVRIGEMRSNPEKVHVNLGDSIFASEERLEHQYDSKNRNMRPDDAVRYTKQAIETAKQTGAKQVMVQFFGGEPMLNWRACAAVLHQVGHQYNGVAVRYSTVTNGSVITDEIARTLAEYSVAVCVSFDSVGSTNRPLKDGSDSTPLIEEGLSLLSKYKNYIAINAALTSDTWDEFNDSIVAFASKYDAREIGVVVDFDPTFYSRFSADEVVDKLWRVIVAGSKRGIVLTGYWHQIFQVLTDFDGVARRGFKNCSAKGAQFSIEPNGGVFSCKAGSGFFGKIDEGSGLLQSTTYKAHAELRHENPTFCKGCAIEGFCAGLCLGPIEKKFGAVDAVEPDACDFYRGITEKLIRHVSPVEVATFELGLARVKSSS